MNYIPGNTHLQITVYYVVNNYIDQSSSFPPTTWADSDVECKRTTNGCESFHKLTSFDGNFSMLAISITDKSYRD
jgi:hypothetical protein